MKLIKDLHNVSVKYSKILFTKLGLIDPKVDSETFSDFSRNIYTTLKDMLLQSIFYISNIMAWSAAILSLLAYAGLSICLSPITIIFFIFMISIIVGIRRIIRDYCYKKGFHKTKWKKYLIWYHFLVLFLLAIFIINLLFFIVSPHLFLIQWIYFFRCIKIIIILVFWLFYDVAAFYIDIIIEIIKYIFGL